MLAQIATQQKVWAEQLAKDPASLARLEPQVHQAFQQLADLLVASLLARPSLRRVERDAPGRVPLRPPQSPVGRAGHGISHLKTTALISSHWAIPWVKVRTAP